MTVSDDDDDGDSIHSVHSDHERDAQHHDRSSSQEHSNGDDSDCTELGNKERESETAIKLMLAARQKRKELRAQKRQAREAKAKALKGKHAPIVRFYLKLSTQHPITGSQTRELKEEREQEKRKSLLQEAHIQPLSSEVSSS